jgi:predicted nucleic acid-binding protein
MAAIFLDTSALVRRYFQPEPGANRVREVCASSRRNVLVVARLAAVEIAAALSRRIREGTLTTAGRDRRWRLFEVDWFDQYDAVASTDEIYRAAEQLVFRYPLKTLDAIQVASALAVAPRLGRAPLQFWTADRQQANAARSEGLAVEFVA